MMDCFWAEVERRLQQKIVPDCLKLSTSSNCLKIHHFWFQISVRAAVIVFAWQRRIGALHQAVPEVFRGTSNVLLAKELGITPIGTMAHEFLQAFQALDVRLRDFQKAALETRVQEYRGDLGHCLD